MSRFLKIESLNKKKYIYFFSVLTMIIGFFLGIKHVCLVPDVLMIIGFLTSFFGFLLINNKKVHVRILPIYLFLSLFWDLSFFRRFKDLVGIYKVNALVGVVTLNIPLIICLISTIRGKFELKKIINNKNLICCCIGIFFVLLSLETLPVLTRLDTNIYYNELKEACNWNMSFSSVSDLFLGGHSCVGYSIFGMSGFFATPNSPIGVRCVNIILVIISIWCFFGILQRFIKSDILSGILTATFVFNPLILGIIYEINLDLPQTCFYIWLIYNVLQKDYLYSFISSILLVYSKETGVILLFGVFLGCFFVELNSFIKDKSLKKIDYKIILIGVLSGVLWIINEVMGLLWRQDSINEFSADSDRVKMDSINFSKENIIVKTKEMFLANFSWITILLILICLLLYFGNKKRRKSSIDIKKLLPIIISFLLFVMFQYIYVTYIHIRYIMPYLVGLIIIFGVLINAVFDKYSYALGLLLSIVFLIQSFYTLDPITKTIFSNISVGETQIITTRTYRRSYDNLAMLREDDPEKMSCLDMTQSAIYNRQFLYFEFAFEKALEVTEYDDDTLIVISPTYEKLPGMTWICLFGQWYTDKLHYNPDTYKLLDDDTKPSLNIAVYATEDVINIDDYKHVYYFDLPYNSFVDNSFYLYNILYTDYYQVSKRGWIIDIYKVK